MPEYSEQDAQLVLESSAAQAEGLLGDASQVNDILEQVKAQAANLPATAAGALANVPTMIAMVKGYITQEYANVSPKVVASVLGALLYLIKGKDLIPDSIPVLGFVDDFAVVALAMKLNEAEIDEFKAWQKKHGASAEI